MANSISNFFALVRPYDSSVGENFSMYDREPYNRDLQICGNEMIGMETGNILKYYHYQEAEPFLVKHADDIIIYQPHQSPPAKEVNNSFSSEHVHSSFAEEDIHSSFPEENIHSLFPSEHVHSSFAEEVIPDLSSYYEDDSEEEFDD